MTKPDDIPQDVLERAARKMLQIARPNGGGDWRDLAPLDPYTFSQVWINRKGWEAPQLVDPNRLDPMMNAVGLEWQPAHADAERDTVH